MGRDPVDTIPATEARAREVREAPSKRTQPWSAQAPFVPPRPGMYSPNALTRVLRFIL